MLDQIQTLLNEMKAVAEQVQTIETSVSSLVSAKKDAVNTAKTQLDELHASFQGTPADAFFVARDNAVAKAIFMLNSLEQWHDSLQSWRGDLLAAHDHNQQAIANAMGWLLPQFWELLCSHYTPGRLLDIHVNGPGNSGGIGWIWENHIAPFLDGNAVTDSGVSDAQMQHQLAHPSSYGHLIDYANGLLKQGHSAQDLDWQVWHVDSLLYQFYCDISTLTNAQLVSAATLPSACHTADSAPQPQPVQPTLTPAQVQDAVTQLHDSAYQGNYLVNNYFANMPLNAADEQLIAQAFQQKYGQDLAKYLLINLNGPNKSTNLFMLYQMFCPQQIQTQDFVNATQDGPDHVILPGMLAQVGVVTPGTRVPYGFWSQQDGKADNQPLVFAIPQADAQQHGAGNLITPLQMAAGFPCEGTYTVVVEYPPVPGSMTPRYMTFTQKVVNADKLSPILLAMMANGGAQGGATHWPSASDYLTNVQTNCPQYYGDASRKLDDTYTPIPALYIPSSGQTQYIPMSLFVKHNSDGSYTLVDATNPSDIRVYNGSSFGDVWHNGFIQNNPLPDGQISAIAPSIDGQPANFPPVNGSPANATMWNAANNDHSAAVNVQHAFGVLSAIAMVVGFFFPPAFLASGLFGAAAGGMQIIDQAIHGDWKWDWQHGLEVAGVVMNVGFAGDGVSAVTKIFTEHMADGAVKISLEGFAKSSAIAGQKVVTGSLITMSVMITGQGAQEAYNIIQADQAAGKSPDQIWQDLQAVLGSTGIQLAVTVGLPFLAFSGAKIWEVLATRFGRQLWKSGDVEAFFTSVQDGTVKDADMKLWADRLGISDDLLKQVATDPNMQAALAQGNPSEINNLFAQYKRDVLPQVKAGRSNTTFADYLFKPVGSGDLPTLCRYQQTHLDSVLNDPAGIANQAGLSQSQMEQFLQELRGNPKMQMALAGDGSFDLARMEGDYKAWLDAQETGTLAVADKDFYMYVSRHDSISVDVSNGTDCAQSAAQYDAQMGGDPNAKVNIGDGVTTPTDLATALGKDPGNWMFVHNSDDLKALMQAKGDGARCIVYGSRGPGEVGHYFNVINDHGTIEILDAQTHLPVDMSQFHDFSVLPTAEGTGNAWAIAETGSDGAIMSPHLDEVGGATATPAELHSAKFDEAQITSITQAGYSMGDIRALMDAGFSRDEITSMARHVKDFTPDMMHKIIGELRNPNYRLRSPDRLRQIVRSILDDADFVSNDPNPNQAQRANAAHREQAQMGTSLLDDLVGYEGPTREGQGYHIENGQIVYGNITYPPDLETPGTLIEMGLVSGGKQDQMLRAMSLDPEGKPIILYAPDYTDAGAQTIWANARNPTYNPLGVDVYVISARGDTQAAYQQFMELRKALDLQTQLSAELQQAMNVGDTTTIARVQAQLQANQTTLAKFQPLHQ